MSYILRTALADKLCSLNRGTRFIRWLDVACISNSLYAQSHLLTLDPQSPRLPHPISSASNYSQSSIPCQRAQPAAGRSAFGQRQGGLAAISSEGSHIIPAVGFRAQLVRISARPRRSLIRHLDMMIAAHFKQLLIV